MFQVSEDQHEVKSDLRQIFACWLKQKATIAKKQNLRRKEQMERASEILE